MAAGELEYYVIRPWHSPDEYFHRTITEFLLGGSARSACVPARSRSSAASLPARTRSAACSRGGVPHEWLEPGSDARATASRWPASPTCREPIVLLLDGRALRNPDNATLAAAYGLSTAFDADDDADVVVVGAGPGGLAAAVTRRPRGSTCSCRARVDRRAGRVELADPELPRVLAGISGLELAQRAYQQAWVFGARFAHAREVRDRAARRRLRGACRARRRGARRSVVLATGCRTAGSTCRARALRGRGRVLRRLRDRGAGHGREAVFVVGGGNSAGQAALHLARYASSVTLLVRGATLADSMSQYLIDQLHAQGVVVRSMVEVVGGGGEGARAHPPGATGEIVEEACRTACSCSSARRRAPTGCRRSPARPLGYVLTGPAVTEAGGGRPWPLERGAVPARDERARGVRGRRRAPGVREARGVGRGGGLGRRVVGAQATSRRSRRPRRPGGRDDRDRTPGPAPWRRRRRPRSVALTAAALALPMIGLVMLIVRPVLDLSGSTSRRTSGSCSRSARSTRPSRGWSARRGCAPTRGSCSCRCRSSPRRGSWRCTRSRRLACSSPRATPGSRSRRPRVSRSRRCSRRGRASTSTASGAPVSSGLAPWLVGGLSRSCCAVGPRVAAAARPARRGRAARAHDGAVRGAGGHRPRLLRVRGRPIPADAAPRRLAAAARLRGGVHPARRGRDRGGRRPQLAPVVVGVARAHARRVRDHRQSRRSARGARSGGRLYTRTRPGERDVSGSSPTWRASRTSRNRTSRPRSPRC